jgi:hypothetical protein
MPSSARHRGGRTHAIPGARGRPALPRSTVHHRAIRIIFVLRIDPELV